MYIRNFIYLMIFSVFSESNRIRRLTCLFISYKEAIADIFLIQNGTAETLLCE